MIRYDRIHEIAKKIPADPVELTFMNRLNSEFKPKRKRTALPPQPGQRGPTTTATQVFTPGGPTPGQSGLSPVPPSGLPARQVLQLGPTGPAPASAPAQPAGRRSVPLSPVPPVARPTEQPYIGPSVDLSAWDTKPAPGDERVWGRPAAVPTQAPVPPAARPALPLGPASLAGPLRGSERTDLSTAADRLSQPFSVPYSRKPISSPEVSPLRRRNGEGTPSS